MAINTYKTFLMVSDDGSTYEKLIDIKDFGDLGSAAPTLDSTTLSDAMHTYINDIGDTGGGIEFTANYTKTGYTAVKAYAGVEKYYAVWFGGTESGGTLTPDGSEGKFSFKGELSCWKKGAGVSAVQDMGISIAPTTAITFA